MKRFHVHTHVDDLQASIDFYSRLFAAPPTRVESEYAKWMLDDPRIHFAISRCRGASGVDHLGLQTDSAEELVELQARVAATGIPLRDQGHTSCCYARSQKHWITDPQGIAWEHFHTFESIPAFGCVTEPVATAEAAVCCAPPAQRGQHAGMPVAPVTSCC